MGDGFSNPVTNAIGVLVREVLQSINFVAGISGWAIYKNGNAEFNDVTVRGEFAVTDPDGSEVRIFDDNPGTGARIDIRPADVVGHTITTGFIYAESDPIFGFPSLLISSPQLDASDTASIDITSGDASVGQGSYIWMRATQRVYVLAPEMRVSGPINTKTPASAVDQPVVETWHTIGLQNLWVARGGAYATLSYRLVSSPPNSVQVTGQIINGIIANNTVISNPALPVGYRPASPQGMNVTSNKGGIGQIEVGTDGNLRVFDLAAGTTILGWNGTFPLDI